MSNGGKWLSREQGASELANNFDIPSITLTDLKPDTAFMVRIAIYKDYENRSLGKSTSVIEFTTDRKSRNFYSRINYFSAD